MSKRTVGNYIKLPREIFKEEYRELTVFAKLLYVFLHELDMRYTGTKKKDYFYRSNDELAKDMNVSVSTIKRAKQELKDAGLINTSYVNWWTDKEHTKLSKKHVTSYKMK